jgi:formylglycine-generating enzyme required for sulfatase activity
VWLPAGRFALGASEGAVTHGQALCQREPGLERPLVVFQCGLSQVLGVNALTSPCARFAFEAEGSPYTALLQGFSMDRTEVTVEAYDRCVRAGRCASGWLWRAMPRFGGASQPVVGLRWDDARAYCAWAGGRLPTEAEWERAARGPDGRPFPWGWQWDPRRANHGALRVSCTDELDGYTYTAPVGVFPSGASPDGILDLAGNVAEYVTDRATLPLAPHPAGVWVSPSGPSQGPGHVAHGGSWREPSWRLRATARRFIPEDERPEDVGFRCVYE